MKEGGASRELQSEGWDGVERRSGKDRRQSPERRATDRTFWERRSGQDRRGHPFYAYRRPA